MKRFHPFLFAILMVACGDDPARTYIDYDPNNPGLPDIDMTLVSAGGTDGSRHMAYDLRGFDRYYKSALTKNVWVIDNEMYFGGPSYTSWMMFRDGRIILPMSTHWANMAPYPTTQILSHYKRWTGKELDLYVKSDEGYNPDSRTMTVSGLKFEVQKYTAGEIILIDRRDIHTGSADHLEGQGMSVLSYQASEPLQFDNSKEMLFDRDVDAFRYIVSIARERFGDQINLNDGNSYVELDYPIIRFDDVDEWIDRYEDEPGVWFDVQIEDPTR